MHFESFCVLFVLLAVFVLYSRHVALGGAAAEADRARRERERILMEEMAS